MSKSVLQVGALLAAGVTAERVIFCPPEEFGNIRVNQYKGMTESPKQNIDDPTAFHPEDVDTCLVFYADDINEMVQAKITATSEGGIESDYTIDIDPVDLIERVTIFEGPYLLGKFPYSEIHQAQRRGGMLYTSDLPYMPGDENKYKYFAYEPLKTKAQRNPDGSTFDNYPTSDNTRLLQGGTVSEAYAPAPGRRRHRVTYLSVCEVNPSDPEMPHPDCMPRDRVALLDGTFPDEGEVKLLITADMSLPSAESLQDACKDMSQKNRFCGTGVRIINVKKPASGSINSVNVAVVCNSDFFETVNIFSGQRKDERVPVKPRTCEALAVDSALPHNEVYVDLPGEEDLSLMSCLRTENSFNVVTVGTHPTPEHILDRFRVACDKPQELSNGKEFWRNEWFAVLNGFNHPEDIVEKKTMVNYDLLLRDPFQFRPLEGFDTGIPTGLTHLTRFISAVHASAPVVSHNENDPSTAHLRLAHDSMLRAKKDFVVSLKNKPMEEGGMPYVHAVWAFKEGYPGDELELTLRDQARTSSSSNRPPHDHNDDDDDEGEEHSDNSETDDNKPNPPSEGLVLPDWVYPAGIAAAVAVLFAGLLAFFCRRSPRPSSLREVTLLDEYQKDVESGTVKRASTAAAAVAEQTSAVVAEEPAASYAAPVQEAPAVEVPAQEVAPVTETPADVTPVVEEVVEETPVVEEAAPVVDETTANAEAAPVDEVTPAIEEVTPAIEEVAPVDEAATPAASEPSATPRESTSQPRNSTNGGRKSAGGAKGKKAGKR